MRVLAVVVAVALGAAGCVGDDEASGSIDGLDSASTSASVLDTAVASTDGMDEVVSPESGSGWERVEVAPETIPTGLAKVVRGGPGLVAVGADGSGGDYDAAVWVSIDGYAWERVEHDEAVFGGPGDQIMRGLASGGPGFVATGFDASSGDRDAAVWVSSDGFVWMRVTDAEGALGGPDDQDAIAVVATDELVVAVGYEQDQENSQDVAVWTSSDGQVWARVSHDEDVLGGTGNQAASAVALSESRFVIAGYDVDVSTAGPDFDAALWVSADGMSWSRVPHDEAVFGGEGWQGMETVLATEQGLVALGYAEHDGPYDTAVWASSDGADWVRVPHDDDELGGAGEQVVRDVAEGDLGLVAVGRDAAGGDDDAAIWSSTDGTAWIQLVDEAFGGPGDQEMRGVALLDDLVVAVGTDRADGEPTAVAWVGRLSDLHRAQAAPDTGDRDPDDSTAESEESSIEQAIARAALRASQRAAQLNALLADEGVDGIDLVDGKFLGPNDAMNVVQTLEVPLAVGALRGRVIFEELYEDAGGEFAIVMFIDDADTSADSVAWVDAAIRSIIRLHEPALPDAQVRDLADDVTAVQDFYGAVGGSFFILHGHIDDLPLEFVGAEAMGFAYSERFDGTTARDGSADSLDFTPVEWAFPSTGMVALIVEASPLAPGDVWGVAEFGGRLIWEETTLELCTDMPPSDCTAGPFIAIRDAGDDYLHIGDVFGFDERPDLEEAAAAYGLPTEACIFVEIDEAVHEFCAPLGPTDG